MTDEELNAMVERLQTKQRDWIAADEMMHAAASAIRQLMRERDEARMEASAAEGTITEMGYGSF